MYFACISVHLSQSRFCQLINSSFLIRARVSCGDALFPRLSYAIAHKVSMRSQPYLSPLHYLLRSVCTIFISLVHYLDSQTDSLCLDRLCAWAYQFSAFPSAKKENKLKSTLQPALDRKPGGKKLTKGKRRKQQDNLFGKRWFVLEFTISFAQLILYKNTYFIHGRVTYIHAS